MNDKKRFAVALIGVPEYERTIIKSIFKLSLYRAYTYILTAEGDPGQIILGFFSSTNTMIRRLLWF